MHGRSPRWRKCIYTVQSTMQQETSRLYMSTYFPASTRSSAEELLTDIKSRFAHELETVPWMNNSTRTLALSKLSMMGMSVGGPDEVQKREPLQLHGDAFLANSIEIDTALAARERARLMKVQYSLTMHIAQQILAGSRTRSSFSCMHVQIRNKRVKNKLYIRIRNSFPPCTRLQALQTVQDRINPP
jgi:predicted metalloendopeptidase